MLTSKDNPLIRHIKKLQTDKDYRTSQHQYILENPKNIQDMITTHPHLITQVIHSIPLPFHSPVPTQEISPSLMSHASSLKTPAGIMAIMIKTIPTTLITDYPCLWVLDQLSDPSNVGTIIRNAVAFNIPAIVLTQGCADHTHPKAVQSSAGQIHKIDIIQGSESLWKTTIIPKFQIITLKATAATPITQFRSNHPLAIVFGSEGHGIITPYILNTPHTALSITMTNNVDSLNVATTSGILGYAMRSFSQ